MKRCKQWRFKQMTPEQELFRDCGEINAITIPVDKHTGRAKGFAYLEFADKVSDLNFVFDEHVSDP